MVSKFYKKLFCHSEGVYRYRLSVILSRPGMAQSFADQGILESVDQVTFGHSNYGQRFFLNLSSHSDIANSSSSTLIEVKGFLDQMSGVIMFLLRRC
jgi:hypothetical protein